ncbi:MAG: putative metal-binding motif-containing protein [Myxococcota bacterium]|nr:putative metal-binding motif-containing protein [Myxococcota bacterium]
MLLLILACMPQLHSTDSGEPSCSAYLDQDGDGYGAGECVPPNTAGSVQVGGDCDDDNAEVNPGATEICDGLDNDCSGSVDDDATDAIQMYSDRDGDGYGKPTSPATACPGAEGYVANDQDCDDERSDVSPDALEYCDGIDNDCDDQTDEPDAEDAPLWHADNDRDGFGTYNAPFGFQCNSPGDLYAPNKDDCDDSDANVYPGQTAWFGEPSVGGIWDYDCSGSAELEYPYYPECDSNCSGIAVPGLVTLTGLADCGEWGDLAIGCKWYSLCSPYGDVSLDQQRCH